MRLLPQRLAELPAYYIPGAKQLMDYDIKLDINLLTLRPCAALLADKPCFAKRLNKIEWVMQYENYATNALYRATLGG